MTVKEYATQQDVSVQAVYQSLRRYKDQLQGHIVRKDRQTQLDDYAVSFLLEHQDRTKKTIKANLITIDSEQVIALRTQIQENEKRYLQEIRQAQEMTASAQKQVQEQQQIISDLQKQIADLQSQKQSRSIWRRIFG